MRDYLIAAIMGLLALGSLTHPWLGIIGWTWISLMNPHKLSWALKDKPVALLFAVVTFIGIVVTKDRRNFSLAPEAKLILVFMLWISIVYRFFSLYPEDCDEMWSRIMKIDLMVLMTMVILTTRRHLVTFVWTITFSIGYYGFKGGIFTIITGGGFKVWGPEGSFIEGNNEVALALIVIIPLIRFLQLQVPSKWVKKFLGLWMLLCAAAALGSQSRGALLALGGMGGVMWLRSGNKLVSGIFMVVFSLTVFAVMPASWTDRMNTTKSYDKDASAMGRINAWYMAWNLVKDYPAGGGLSVAQGPLFARYAPDPLDVHAAHSIYFQILGEQGYLGLFIFMLLWIMTWRAGGQLMREGRKREETLWVSQLGAMCQVALAGYAVGGTFLSLAYFDLPYNIVVLVVLSRNWVKEKAWTTEPALTGKWAKLEVQMGLGRL